MEKEACGANAITIIIQTRCNMRKYGYNIITYTRAESLQAKTRCIRVWIYGAIGLNANVGP